MSKRILKLVISVGVFLGDWLWRHACHLVGASANGRRVVLYYHGISEQQRKRFGLQLDTISRYARVIPADSVLVPDPVRNYVAITFDDGFSNVLKNAVPELVRRGMSFTVFVPAIHVGGRAEWIENEKQREPLMEQRDLRYLSGLELAIVGSHCMTHSNLVDLKDEAAVWEIFESRRQLESITANPVRLLSFPYGAYSKRHSELARKAGYTRVFSVVPHEALLDQDEFVTGRVSVTPDDWGWEFRMKILGAYRWLPIAFWIKRKTRMVLSFSHAPATQKQV